MANRDLTADEIDDAKRLRIVGKVICVFSPVKT